ncbi:ATP-dependent DNA ligase [Nocardia sp. NPDC050435]|uniref:ATP-dependent DNA ligase n=1 Tax=Nocardia sp. NPDC050435 TaxID=3155040 RepID=UPI00340E43D3
MSVPAPMLATAGRPPEDSRLWARELKWDGMRAVAVVSAGQCRFYSRNLRNVTPAFPELAAEVGALAGKRSMIIDGEIIAPEPSTGAPSFVRLQHRMHVARPTVELIRAYPTQLFAFDVLEIEGRSTMALPYSERRSRLVDLEINAPLVRTPPSWTDVGSDDLLVLAQQHHLEGIVSKRLDSVYRPGQRSRLWVKTPLRRSTDVIVSGWVAGSDGGRSLGSLVLGAYNDSGQLVYVGHVGSGFSSAAAQSLRQRLDGLAQDDHPFDLPPPRQRLVATRWVRPTIVGSVHYREFVGALRHASWQGVRLDVEARAVHLPP